MSRQSRFCATFQQEQPIASQKDAPLSEPSDRAKHNLPIVRALMRSGGEVAVADHVGRLRIERDELQSTVHRLEAEKGLASLAYNEAQEALDNVTYGADPGSLVERVEHLVAHTRGVRAENESLKAQLTALSSATAEQRQHDFAVGFSAGWWDSWHSPHRSGPSSTKTAEEFAAYLASEGSQ